MNRKALVDHILQKKNYLCIGLDTDIEKIPVHLRAHPNAVFEFNKAIIDATKEYCVSYKINTAFYEAMGVKGWEALEQTIAYIPKSHFTIADAKRGDIGNTSAQYAKAFFDVLGFDAITVAPYMGEDSLRPFLDRQDKWTIVLALTSNAGSADFEQLRIAGGDHFLYEAVMEKVAAWGTPYNLMFVTGATKAAHLGQIRQKFPSFFFLVPGVGSQGGDLAEVAAAALTAEAGLLVNVSRAILYADGSEDFAAVAARVSNTYAQEMERTMTEYLK